MRPSGAHHPLPDPNWLAPFVVKIVQHESPVHEHEVTQRITEACVLKRTGNRIQSVVKRAVDQAVRQNLLTRRGDFLWIADMTEVMVRDRSQLDSNAKKLELVAPEEIEQVLMQEIARGFSLSVEGDISVAARALGFQRVTLQSLDVFRQSLRKPVDDGRVTKSGDLLKT